MNAAEILQSGIDAIGDRAKDRDLPDGERSMLRAVVAFEALTKVSITETHGWLFMAVLKLSRATAGRHRADDWIDLCGYGALAGESAERANQSPRTLQAAIAEIRLAAAELDE